MKKEGLGPLTQLFISAYHLAAFYQASCFKQHHLLLALTAGRF